MNRQSAAKHLISNTMLENDGSSTTIPRKGSTLYKHIMEKPSTIYKLFNERNYNTSSYIYCIFSNKNDKVYIGSTKCFNKRLQKHRQLLKANKHHSKSLQNYYNKYKNLDDLYVCIIEELDNNITNIELSIIEENYIKLFDSVRNGFNDSYNTYRHLITDEQIAKNKEKQSKSVIELDLNGTYIKKHLSVTEAAKSINDQSTNISACCKGKLRYVKNRIWIYEKDYNTDITYKIRDKNSNSVSYEQARKRAMLGKKSKSINVYDINMNFIKQIDCITDVLKFLNLSLGGYSYRLIKNIITLKTPYKAIYYFKYSEDMV